MSNKKNLFSNLIIFDKPKNLKKKFLSQLFKNPKENYTKQLINSTYDINI